MHTTAIELKSVHKTYVTPAGVRATALNDVNLGIQPGELVILLGRSGSGKSTLLNLVAGLDRADSGSLTVAGQPLMTAGENDLASWRGRTVGIVFQFFQLLPTLTVLENVLLAMDFVGVIPRTQRTKRALRLLTDVGVVEHAAKLPSALSGGQQQRAAIARAIANDPPILVADEPTGNLDSATADAVLTLFDTLIARGRTLLIATHDESIAARAHRVIRLLDGRVVENRSCKPAGAAA